MKYLILANLNGFTLKHPVALISYGEDGNLNTDMTVQSSFVALPETITSLYSIHKKDTKIQLKGNSSYAKKIKEQIENKTIKEFNLKPEIEIL